MGDFGATCPKIGSQESCHRRECDAEFFVMYLVGTRAAGGAYTTALMWYPDGFDDQDVKKGTNRPRDEEISGKRAARGRGIHNGKVQHSQRAGNGLRVPGVG